MRDKPDATPQAIRIGWLCTSGCMLRGKTTSDVQTHHQIQTFLLHRKVRSSKRLAGRAQDKTEPFVVHMCQNLVAVLTPSPLKVANGQSHLRSKLELL